MPLHPVCYLREVTDDLAPQTVEILESLTAGLVEAALSNKVQTTDELIRRIGLSSFQRAWEALKHRYGEQLDQVSPEERNAFVENHLGGFVRSSGTNQPTTEGRVDAFSLLINERSERNGEER